MASRQDEPLAIAQPASTSGETEFLGEIIFGIGGLIGGFSGGYIYANSRRR